MTLKRRTLYALVGLLTLIMGLFSAVIAPQRVQAETLTNYTITGAQLTTEGTVSNGQTMDFSIQLSLSNEQVITAGDQLSLTLPEELEFPSSLDNQMVHLGGQTVATYTTDAQSNLLTLTFNQAGQDYFATNHLDKGLELGFKVIVSRSVRDNTPTASQISFDYPLGNTLSYDYAGNGDGLIDGTTFKYGYVSAADPTLINWFVLVNGSQSLIRNIVIEDSLGAGQSLVGNVRLVQLPYSQGGYTSEAAARAVSADDNLSQFVTYQDANGQLLSSGVGAQTFRFSFDDMRGHNSPYNNVYGGGASPEYSKAMLIQYSSRITDTSQVSGTLANTLTVSGSNLPERHLEKTVSYDFSAWGIAWGNKAEAATITAQKVLQDSQQQELDIKAGRFSFELYELEADGTERLLETVTNGDDGSIRFSPITYTSQGSHQYQVREKIGTETDITYSQERLTYFVNVTLENDQYLAAVSNPVEGTTITNTYTPNTPIATTASLTATKVLEGRDLQKGEFSFELIDQSGQIVQTATNQADGQVAFQPLTFAEAGTYTYTIKEVKGTDSSITYDDKVLTALVTVTDQGQGRLVATVAYDRDLTTFNNRYTAPTAAKLVIKAHKILGGRILEEGQFEFTLTDQATGKVSKARNAADGTITFDALHFDQEGTFTFELAELPGNLPGVSYSQDKVTIDIKVWKSGNQFQAQVMTPELLTPDAPVHTFTNSYTAKPTQVTLNLEKRLNGRPLKAGEFTFNLLDKAGNLIEAVTNTADGQIIFSPLTYDKAGSYTYTVKEVKGSDSSITYDNKAIDIQVTVEDTGQGQLVAETAYPKTKQFVNTFVQQTIQEPVDKPKTPDTTAPTKPTNKVTTSDKTPQTPKKEQSTQVKLPDTGDQTGILLLTVGCLILGLVGLKFRRK